MDEATINDILGQMGMQEASPEGKVPQTPSEPGTPNEGETPDHLGNTHISIDINDSLQLEAQGLKRVQIEGFQPPNGQDDQEFLMDNEGNIYDLNGNFVATMGNDEESEED